MNSIPRFTYTVSSKQQTSTAIKEALSPDLPSDLTNIISDYVHEDIDYHLVSRSLEFDSDGNITNPEVRAAYKAVFKSPFVPASVKSQLLTTISDDILYPYLRRGDLYELESRAITGEIISDGDRIELADIDISHVKLELNLRGANLRGATIRHASISSSMSHADLTGAQFIDVVFDWVDLDHVVTTGMKMINCVFNHVSITGSKISDPKLLKLVCKGLKHFNPGPHTWENGWLAHYDGAPEGPTLRLNGHMDASMPKRPRARTL